MLAGLAEGVWGSLDELASLWKAEREHRPVASAGDADTRHAAWHAAVERSLGWAQVDDGSLPER